MSVGNKFVSFKELPKRVLGPSGSKTYSCSENYEDFYFEIPRVVRKKGVSCLIRIKNEVSKIKHVIESVKGVFDEIVVIDNGSSDGTRELLDEYYSNDPHIKVYDYPFELSKIGPSHGNTDKNSIHSFSYYTNWSLSKCRYSYVFKWDGDMVLDIRDSLKLRKYLLQLSSWWPTFVSVQILTVYQKSDKFFFDRDEVNSEIEIFPLRSDVYFDKDDNFERLTAKFYKVEEMKHSDIRIYEWKNTSEDEFSHWSTTEFPSARKKLEWNNFHKIKGTVDPSIEFDVMESHVILKS